MKFVFISASFATIYLMYVKFKATYDHNHDTFRIEFLLVPCLVLALLINHEFTVMEVRSKFAIPNCFAVSPTDTVILFKLFQLS